MRGRSRRSPGPAQDGVIRALVPRRGDAERVTVRLQGSFCFDVAAVLVQREGLRVGDPLPAAAQERLLEEDAPFRARETALGFLSYRDRSAREVQIRLESAGFDPRVVDDAVSWLKGIGYVDDARFATRYAAEKARAGWGAQRIRAELMRKGVERAVVDAALAAQEESEAFPVASGEEVALALARKRFGAQFAVDPRGAANRLAGFLLRRGFDWDAVGRIQRVLRAEGEGHAVGGQEEEGTEPVGPETGGLGPPPEWTGGETDEAGFS